MVSSDCQLLSA